jgi:hypothetical protein
MNYRLSLTSCWALLLRTNTDIQNIFEPHPHKIWVSRIKMCNVKVLIGARI